MRKVFLTTFLIISFCAFSHAQPPPASSGAVKVTKISQERSLRDLKADDHFSSVDGRFTIAMPKSISGFMALTPQTLRLEASGGQFSWQLKEGGMTISYYDYADKTFDLKTEKDFAYFFDGFRDAILSSFKGKLLNERRLKLGEHRGYHYAVETATGSKVIARVYYVMKRNYSLVAIPSTDVPNAETIISNALDSLALISRSKIDADMLKSLESSAPAPLPQEPVVPKERSDIEDDGLKGKVRSVTGESEDLSGTGSKLGRHPSFIEDYNEKGNTVKRTTFDYRGNPSEITSYGYIDGRRVSKFTLLSYEYNPPPMMSRPERAVPGQRVKDTRINYSYTYKYKDGKLAEMQMFYNDGRPGMRYTYSREADTLENLAFDDQGKLNQKYIYKLDKYGNAIEEIRVDLFPSQTFGDRKYLVKYDSFDKNGNWTMKTTSKIVIENGKQIAKPWYISYRSITYY